MSSSFFVAFRVLPRRRRIAIETVYAFCRRTDDAVDEASDPVAARAALAAVRRELDAVFAPSPGGAQGGALGEVVRAFALPREPFDLLVEGVSWDLEGRRYETRDDLREYCRRVASSVGTLCVRIFGCADSACDAYARELGVALQWTNILRDLRGDLARGRVYLPAASLRQHGLAPEDLRAAPRVETRDRVAALVRAEAGYARSCFAQAGRLLPPEERKHVLAGSIMGGVYETLLGKIEAAGSAVLERRIRISGPRRAWVALRILLREHAASTGGDAR